MFPFYLKFNFKTHWVRLTMLLAPSPSQPPCSVGHRLNVLCFVNKIDKVELTKGVFPTKVPFFHPKECPLN